MSLVKRLVKGAPLTALEHDNNLTELESMISGGVRATIVSASICNIGTTNDNVITVSGTTTITSFGVSKTGKIVTVIFTSALNIAHNSVSLLLPSSTTLNVGAGGVAQFQCIDGTNGYWICVGYIYSAISSAEISFLNGVTSNIQTQLNSKITSNAPLIKTANYTVVATDTNLIFNGTASITLTLGTATAGRVLNLKNIAGFAVVSASSNVVPINSAIAGTAILPATAGKYCTLVGDGTKWVIMGGN